MAKKGNNLMFPKPGKKKKRKPKKRESILHRRDGTCYLCKVLENDWTRKWPLEEHHVFGHSNRNLSTEYGLTVFLCQRHHVNWSKDSPHYNKEYMDLLRRNGQRAFVREFPGEDFYALFGKNHL